MVRAMTSSASGLTVIGALTAGPSCWSLGTAATPASKSMEGEGDTASKRSDVRHELYIYRAREVRGADIVSTQ